MARYNTAPQTLEVTGETEFTYAFTGGIISLTGTPGYEVDNGKSSVFSRK